MTRSIQARLEEIGQTNETLNGQYEEGQTLLNRLARGQTVLSAGRESWSTEEIQVEDIPACEVLFTRRIKKNYKNSDVSVDRWFELFKMVSKHNLRVKGPVILTYHNKPLEQFFKVDCDLEISIEVNEHQDLPIFKQFGGFRAVTALHIGRKAVAQYGGMRFAKIRYPFKAPLEVLRLGLSPAYFLGNKQSVKVFFYSGAVYAAVLHLCYSV